MAESGGGKEATGAAPGAPEDLGAQSGTSDVFISYASQDAAVADAVVRSLERAGLKCWIAPRDVVPGALYADEIVRAINESKVVVLVLSEQAVASPHVGKEIERASSKRRRIVALRIDSAALTRAFEYFLSESQWIDVGSAGIEAMGAKLVDAVRRHLAPGSDVEPAVPSDRHTLDRKSATPQPRWILIVSVAVLAMALAYFVVEKFWLSKHATSERPIAAAAPAVAAAAPAISEKSIAVLPFVDMSEKKDQEYFARGIAEEILNRLAKVPGLKVVGRTSSFQFNAKSTDLTGVGAALGASYLLEGSVHRDGNRVRVTAQLVEARTGSQRWSDRFDSDVIDVLGVQDSIAAAIARALQIVVEGGTEHRSSIKSPEALDAYLRGLQSVDRNTQEGLEIAVAYFQQALSLDPTFAPAAIGLARAYSFLGSWGWLPPRVGFEHAREAARLAQQLDPKSPLPHVYIALIHVQYDCDWVGADRELQQAFALGPRDSVGAQVGSFLAAALGHWDDAKQLGVEAVALDPLNADAYGTLELLVYLGSGQLAEAEQSIRRALQIEPHYGAGHYFLGEVLMLQGRYDAALAEFRNETPDDGELVGSAMVHFVAGRKAESDAKLAEAIRVNATDWPYGIAGVYAFRGEKDRAFEWLDRAYEARDHLYMFKGDPLLKNLKGDPRYKAFLRKMNLPE